MNKSISQLTDAVLGNSAALDAVFDSFDFAADTSFDGASGASYDSQETRTESSSQKVIPKRGNRENRKRRLPWLGL